MSGGLTEPSVSLASPSDPDCLPSGRAGMPSKGNQEGAPGSVSAEQLTWAEWKDAQQAEHRCICDTCWRAYLRDSLGVVRALELTRAIQAATEASR